MFLVSAIPSFNPEKIFWMHFYKKNGVEKKVFKSELEYLVRTIFTTNGIGSFESVELMSGTWVTLVTDLCWGCRAGYFMWRTDIYSLYLIVHDNV